MYGRSTRGGQVVRAALPLATSCLAAAVPDDPDFALQWALHNTGQTIEGHTGLADADIDAPEAWDVHAGLSTVTVAIVGRGVDPHPEFADRLLAGRAFVGDLFNTRDTCPHDTHLAGIIAAATDNGVGIAGLNGQARILPVRVFDGCGGSADRVAEGTLWAVDQGAAVILIPIQFADPSTTLSDAVAFAAKHDVVVVAPVGSAGNNEVNFPAAYGGCLAVSATTNEDTFSSASNYGPEVDLAAPGRSIWSTWGDDSYGFQPSDRDTASASAFVAGAAALIRSYAPQLTASQVSDVLLASADDLGEPGWDERFGFGRLNVAHALKTAAPPALRFEPVEPFPAALPPEMESSFGIKIADAAERLLPGSASLFYRNGDGGYMSVPLTLLTDDLFAAELPALACGASLEYYLEAESDVGTTIREPIEAPSVVHVASPMKQSVLFEDQFEEEHGWEVEGGNTGTGRWERVIPVATSAQPGFDYSSDVGQFCYVTGQYRGGGDGASDVDGGPMRLVSPLVKVRGDDVEISYARWFVWRNGGTEDFLAVEFSLNDGQTWATVETVSSTNAWVHHSFRLSEFPAVVGDQLRVRFSVSDDPSDSLTEAAVDEFRVAALWCSARPGDANGDNAVDATDHASAVTCWTGPAEFFLNSACDTLDFDRNHRIDLADFQSFQQTFSIDSD